MTTTTTTTYHILINPAAASGRGRKVWKKIRPELARLGVSYRQFFPATPDHAQEIIRGLEKSAKGTGTMAGDKRDGSECHLFPKVTAQNRPFLSLHFINEIPIIYQRNKNSPIRVIFLVSKVDTMVS